jgi:putative tryptophan/tyrosine transport system substrate-binding protein
MRRREFIAGLGGAAMWPVGARGQQTALPVIGLLDSTSLTGVVRQRNIADFRRGLGEIGYVEGRNVAIEYRSAEGNYDRLPALAVDLVRRRVSVISTIGGAPATLAAKSATATIPIVFELAVDPVEMGLVASLNRPGGNITGITNLAIELVPKKLALLHELVPTAAKFAVLVNSNNTNRDGVAKDAQEAARTLGIELVLLGASTESEIDAVFARLGAMRAALVIAPDPFFISQVERFAGLAARYKVPVNFEHREFAAHGGLMSYGGDYAEAYRLAGVYTGRILKGDKPADLPVQQSTRVELIINMKTANALGLTVPTSLLVLANEVIE